MEGLVIEEADWGLDKDQLIKLRGIVFVQEQSVPVEREIDGLDPECQHVKAVLGEQYIGTARLLPDGYIGRMCVLREFRGHSIGSKMLDYLIRLAISNGINEITLNSQASAISFYQRNGFEICSDEFIDAGIVHRKMRLIRT